MVMCSVDVCIFEAKAKGFCIKHYKADYRQKNIEKIKKKSFEYNIKNKNKKSIYDKKYYKQNKKIMKEKQKIYNKKTKEKRAKYLKEYNQINKEKINALKREYSKNHPEIDRNKNRRKRAIKKQNKFEKYTEFQVLEIYGNNCYLCNIPIDMNASRKCGSPGWQYGLHIEHVIDIALGGPDTLDNVRPAHAICNLKKKPKEMV
jgi:hypothetical protein